LDFNKYDSRAKAETGSPMQIKDAWTGVDLMDGDKPCRVILRGTASASMQAKMRAVQKAAMQSKKAKKKDGNEEDEEARVMEDVHNQLCEAAAPFIVGFENVNKGDKPATADDAMWFLNLTFPEMGVKEDADGDNVLNKDGEPVFEMTNNPFAKQCSEFASKQANRLGNAKSG